MASKSKKPVSKNSGHSHDFQTPPYALLPLYPHLKKDKVIWECACGKGNIVDELLKRGYKVKWSDILRDKRENFLTWQPKAGYDIIVTNPPYDLKDEFLERAYSLGKPFAFLLPVESLGGAKRQYYYRKMGLQVILVDKRINFETPDGKGSSAWFPTAWFTWGLGLPSDLTFYEFPKEIND